MPLYAFPTSRPRLTLAAKARVLSERSPTRDTPWHRASGTIRFRSSPDKIIVAEIVPRPRTRFGRVELVDERG